MKNALCQLKTSHPQFKAIMMGQRHTDPHCGQHYVLYRETSTTVRVVSAFFVAS